MRIGILFFLLSFTSVLLAQKARISGLVIDENGKTIANASIWISENKKGYYADSVGKFEIEIPALKKIQIVCSHVGFISRTYTLRLNPDEIETLNIRLKNSSETLGTLILTDSRTRKDAVQIQLNPKTSMQIPGTAGGVEGMIKVLVGGNNELSNQYNVRGGNFDENTVYINDFEVYRPYLVSQGQQEGLSIINPELVRNIRFYSGGFSARFGDKISSVLDIQYQEPKKLQGSFYAGFLEQGFSLGTSFSNGRGQVMTGIRNRNNRGLLSSQATTGAYIPSSRDWQSILHYQLSEQWSWELLSIQSQTSFDFYPESVQKTAAVFSPLYSNQLGLDTYFSGGEQDRYQTNLIGTSVQYKPNPRLQLKWMFSRFVDEEQEKYDIMGAYLFGEIDPRGSGEIVRPLGAGAYQQFARNALNLKVFQYGHRGSYLLKNHLLRWGLQNERTIIKDQLYEFEMRDSAGYTLPYTPGSLQAYRFTRGNTNIQIEKWNGFIQDDISFKIKDRRIDWQWGCRVQYNDLNKEWLLSPRTQFVLFPTTNHQEQLRLGVGIYQQPPFYREMRNMSGALDPSILAQKSMQYSLAYERKFETTNRKPIRLQAEAYYKKLWDLIPYDLDNVRIRYLGTNRAKGYARGLECRLYSELTKDAESWISINWMKTAENLQDDYYYNYFNAAGEIIQPGTSDQRVADSARQSIGFLRRPTDRRLSIGLFLQDYLASNHHFKVHILALYGSNMSYNLPDNPKYRNALIIDPYLRVDLGFSALLLNEKSKRRSHHPLSGLENIWLSLEIFNVLDKANTISFQLIKDFKNSTYAIPNRLTPRLLNLKMIARF
jgi:hypothetical protein